MLSASALKLLLVAIGGEGNTVGSFFMDGANEERLRGFYGRLRMPPGSHCAAPGQEAQASSGAAAAAVIHGNWGCCC
jgi:hypothetical protein